MADFGKLDFAVAFNPTSAFPLDGRCYFTSLDHAVAAAATAERVGSTNTRYYFGMRLLVDTGESVKWYTIQQDKTLKADKEDADVVLISQEDYDALVEAGNVDENVYYLIGKGDAM